MGTLGVRFVRHLLMKHAPGALRASQLRAPLESWLDSAPPRPVTSRARQLDGDVASFVRAETSL